MVAIVLAIGGFKSGAAVKQPLAFVGGGVDVCILAPWDRDLTPHLEDAYKRLTGRAGNVRTRLSNIRYIAV